MTAAMNRHFVRPDGELKSARRTVHIAVAAVVIEMPTARKKKPRTFALDHRQRLERAAEHYLRFCYRNKTAARASEFALFVGLTPQYLSWLCRQIAGKSLREFLREKQLAFAARLLRTTPIQIDQIAERAAFGTAGTLYRLFSEAYGMTPGQFRKLKK